MTINKSLLLIVDSYYFFAKFVKKIKEASVKPLKC